MGSFIRASRCLAVSGAAQLYQAKPVTEWIRESDAFRTHPFHAATFLLGACMKRALRGLVEVIDNEIHVHGRPVAGVITRGGRRASRRCACRFL